MTLSKLSFLPNSFIMGAVSKIKLRPDIFEYHDYRHFLKDYFGYLKDTDSSFSIRSLSRKLEVSASYFTMVLNGGTTLSERVIQIMAEEIGFTQNELSFLSHLVRMADAKNLTEQKLAFQKMAKFDLYKARNKDAIIAHQYFSKWYFLAIRELADSTEFKPDPKWISHKLERKVSLTEIREALQFLMKYGYIIPVAGGYRASNRNLDCDGSVYKLALTEFYKQSYELCVESIFKTPREERHLASHTMAITEEGLNEVKVVLNEAVNKIQKITQHEKSKNSDKRVYHVSIATVPWSKKGVKV